jgi:hypothetical protein
MVVNGLVGEKQPERHFELANRFDAILITRGAVLNTGGLSTVIERQLFLGILLIIRYSIT